MLRNVYRATRPQRRAPSCLAPRSPLPIARVCFSTSTVMKSSALQTPQPPLSTSLPADAFQLLPEDQKPANEDALFEEQVNQVKEWWGSERYRGIRRPYTPEDVVSKRGALQQTYPSSLMARKLFNLFKERSAAGLPVHTSMQYPSFTASATEYLTIKQWAPSIPSR